MQADADEVSPVFSIFPSKKDKRLKVGACMRSGVSSVFNRACSQVICAQNQYNAGDRASICTRSGLEPTIHLTASTGLTFKTLRLPASCVFFLPLFPTCLISPLLFFVHICLSLRCLTTLCVMCGWCVYSSPTCAFALDPSAPGSMPQSRYHDALLAPSFRYARCTTIVVVVTFSLDYAS